MAELRAKHDVTLHWLPYELRPEPEPLPEMDPPNLERFRGNWERGVGPLAARYGVEMNFPSYKPRSRWAHETAEFGRDRGQFGAGGYVGRASGRAFDARKAPGYAPYDRLAFEVPTLEAGLKQRKGTE